MGVPACIVDLAEYLYVFNSMVVELMVKNLKHFERSRGCVKVAYCSLIYSTSIVSI